MIIKLPAMFVVAVLNIIAMIAVLVMLVTPHFLTPHVFNQHYCIYCTAGGISVGLSAAQTILYWSGVRR